MEYSDALDRTLELFGIGAALDFVISRFRWSIWRRARGFWSKISSIHPPDIHRVFVSGVLSLWDRALSGDKETREATVAFFGCLFGVLAAANQLRVERTPTYQQIMEATLVATLVFGYFVSLFLCLKNKHLRDFLNRHLSERSGHRLGLVLGAPAVVLAVVGTVGLLGPVPQGWKIATMGLMASVWGDVLSVRVTLFVLRWVANRGPLLGLFGAIADTTCAFLLSFVTAAGIVLGNFVPNLMGLFSDAQLVPEFQEGTLGVYMATLQFTAFVPTVLLWVVFSSLCLLKIAQLVLQKSLLLLIDLAADPTDKGRATPFTMIAFAMAMLVWLWEFLKALIVFLSQSGS